MRPALTGRLLSSVTIGIHPTAYGYGFAAFTGPFTPVRWGVRRSEGDKNTESLLRIERLFDRLPPETIVLERFEGTRSRRSARVQSLCRAIVALAQTRGIDVAIYDRADVEATFAHTGARTRDEIAAAVATHVDVLRRRLPRKRQPWQSEDNRLALFAAAALTLTHFRLDAHRLLSELA